MGAAGLRAGIMACEDSGVWTSNGGGQQKHGQPAAQGIREEGIPARGEAGRRRGDTEVLYDSFLKFQ